MNALLGSFFQLAWSVAIAFMTIARDPATFVFRVDDVVLNGEETYWETKVNPGSTCHSYWAWVQFDRVVVHSPDQHCQDDTRYLVRPTPDPWD